jgi:hypothetical protein
MRSIVKENGDVIKQWELVAVLGADRALNALLFNLSRRIALGARVQRGRYDVGVEDFQLGRPYDLAESERSNNHPSGGYNGGIEIDTTEKIAEIEGIVTKGRAERAGKPAPESKPTGKRGARK